MKNFFVLLTAIGLFSCYKGENIGHECRWDKCPYKGLNTPQFKQAVINYTGCDKGADCYNIDVLHLYYPSDDYDQLEERLNWMP